MPSTTTNQKLILFLLLGLTLFPLFYSDTLAGSPDVPREPTNLLAHPSSPTRVDLFWNTPEDDGGSPITDYKIEVKEAGDSYSLLDNTGNATTTYAHTGLTTGVNYIYRVYAINNEGTSAYSSEAIATPQSNSQPLEDIVPNAPTSLTAVDMSPTSIELNWIKPATNNGPPVIGYKIDVKEGSSSYATLVSNTQNTNTKFTDTELTTNTEYKYKIYAINSVGASLASNEASATPLTTSSEPIENIKPNPPKSVNAVPGGPTEIILSWKEPTPNNGPDVTGYEIEYKTYTGDYTLLTNTGLVTTFTHTGLSEGALYTYRMYAINSEGKSSSSNTISTQPGHTTVPTNLQADDISPTSILLTWTAPSQTYGSSITGYTILEVLAPGIYDTVAETSTKLTSYTVTGLKTGDEYTYVVKARFSIGGSSAVSSSVSATPTLESKPPSQYSVSSQPIGLTATAISPIQIDLGWNYPSDDGGTSITGYRIDVKVGNANYITLVQDTDSSTRTYSHLDLTTDTQYSYKVYAINPTGTSGPSNEASAIPSTSSSPPQSKDIPGPPKSLSANPFSPTQINLSWEPPSDDGNSPITGYKIDVKEGTGNYKTLTSNVGKDTKYSHTGLTTGTNYQYRVYSINSIGTSTSSATADATPLDEEPEPESNIPDFVDPKLGAQYYLDRYNKEPAYKEWFDGNFPDYTIEEAIELTIPGTFTDDKKEKPILSFVDTTRDPQYYIDRYTNELTYKEWFDETFPDYTIYEAVGVEETEVQIGTCGPGTILVNGYCVAEKQSGGGCLIATAAFGSELSYQVQSLRELRDNSLLQTNSGQTFLTGFNNLYYSFSPTISDWARQNSVFKEVVKITITPLLTSLSLLNYVDMDSENKVLTYGIGIILLNIGMYFAMPVVAILTIKRYAFNKTN
jgi:hypothetical protein